MNNILQVKDLSYEYEAGKQVLKNVNLEFEQGKTYAIIGKSGSGKTTLISLLSGLEKSQQGDIIFADKNIKEYNLDDYRAHKMGIIFQQYNLLNNYSVKDNIFMAMRIAKKPLDEQKVFDLLQKVGLDKEVALKKPLELSGGQQQRVAIARTLAKDSQVIIADEPTGNLDEQTEKDILSLLNELVKTENKTLIMVTHSKYISDNAEHVYKIELGEVKFEH
ncbi:MAG: ABC transporter ATP-binding protein [Mycoplasmatales bacterium]